MPSPAIAPLDDSGGGGDGSAPPPRPSRPTMLGLLYSIADAGRELLRRGPGESGPGKAILPLCHALMGSRGEASGTALALEVTEAYRALAPAERLPFFRGIKDAFDVDAERIAAAAERYRERRDLDAYLGLAAAVEPPRQELIRRINMAPRGTETLVAMRADLLALLDDHPELKAVDADLRHLLASWFNRGFLVLERIDWNTSAAVLEKLIEHEAVHAMAGWEDLRRRLAGDRRCFAFFHPALPGDPLIFVEVALMRGMPSAIAPLLDHDAPVVDGDADTAVFYSISNCQDGLRGISFGNFLIKQVVLELAKEIPTLRRFVTLSPIPRFRRWLDANAEAIDGGLAPDERAAALAVRREGWPADEAAAEALREPLLRLCARYFLAAKDRADRPLDPVARFHLGNGARLERINWRGDLSAKGLRDSAGLLVNYLYDLKSIEKNHEAYVKTGRVAAAPEVARLAR